MCEKTFKIQDTNEDTNWVEYIDNLDVFLKKNGFRKYNQNHKREDFSYWKEYGKKYQIGLLVYDFRKYPNHTLDTKVKISFECVLFDDNGTCDMSVSKQIGLSEFENMSESFYNSMAEYIY